jgi:hypothetical protein
MQELLAPLSVMTLNRRWKEHGTKEIIAKEISALPGSLVLSCSRTQRRNPKYPD